MNEQEQINIPEMPKWKPNFMIISHKKLQSKSIYKKYIRNASDAFIHRKDVKEYIFSRDKNKCVKCDCTINLTIHHKKPLKLMDLEKDIDFINTEDNLITLCKDCHFR